MASLIKESSVGQFEITVPFACMPLLPLSSDNDEIMCTAKCEMLYTMRTRNAKCEMRSAKCEMRSAKLRNVKFEMRNSKCEIRNAKSDM
jgi:hypothetical protein